MLNKTAYLNGLTKEKELQIFMESHKSNLRHMRSINRNEPQAIPIEINKNKTKYLQTRRQHEINLENQILTQKIEKIVNSSKNSQYFSSNQKYSKSLNEHVKRTAQQKVSQQNMKLLIRLEESKPTYSTKKYLEGFEHLKQVEKKMSTAEFYLTESPTFRKRKLNTNRSFLSRRNSSFGQNSSFTGEKGEITKQSVTLNDGNLWELKIYKDQKDVKITGQVLIGQNQKDYTFDHIETKLIKIPNIEANLFLRKYCENKLNNLIKFLKVDEKDGSLMLIVPQINKHFSPSKLANPQDKGNIQKKLMNVQLSPSIHKRNAARQIFNTVNKKPTFEGLPKFNLTKNQKEKITNVKDSQKPQHQDQEKTILPKIQSLNEASPKELKKIEVCKQKAIQDVNTQDNNQKQKQKKSSESSVKSSRERFKEEPTGQKLNIEKELRNEQKFIKIEDNGDVQQINQKQEQQQEQYQLQNFQQSMNNKLSSFEGNQLIKQEPIKDQNSVSEQKIEEVKSKQDQAQAEDKLENSLQAPIKTSLDRQLETNQVIQNESSAEMELKKTNQQNQAPQKEDQNNPMQ